MTTRLKAILSGGILMGAALLLWAVGGRAQGQSAQGSGVISGTVTANRDYALSEASGNHIPALYAVRVRAQGRRAPHHLHRLHPKGPLPNL